jgi:hypothetical protein
MEWAIGMADPERLKKVADDALQERDKAAVLLIEWMRTHITGGR